MKLILWCLIGLGAGYGLMQLSQFSQGGYVKVFVGDYLLEMKFAAFVIAALIILFLLYYLLRFISGLFRAPKKMSNWNTRRNQNLSQEKLGDGFLSLMKGDWQKAEKQLTAKTSDKYNKVPFVNFLAAAQAAQEQSKYEQRDYYLSQAMQSSPKNKLAVSMTKARLHQQAGQHEAALATLLSVQTEAKKNHQYHAMLVQAYDHQDDFDGLSEALPKARKLGALPAAVLNDIQADVDINSFQHASDKEAAWKNMAKSSRLDPDFIRVYAEYQLSNKRPDVAEKLIKTALKKDWNDSLVNVYGRVVSTHHKKLLRNVDGWLLARPENAELHLAAGRLAAQTNDTQRAEQEFEAAIKLAKHPEAYEELGKLYEANQDLRKALTLYRSGLSASNSAVGVTALLEQESEDHNSATKADDAPVTAEPEVAGDALVNKTEPSLTAVDTSALKNS